MYLVNLRILTLGSWGFKRDGREVEYGRWYAAEGSFGLLPRRMADASWFTHHHEYCTTRLHEGPRARGRGYFLHLAISPRDGANGTTIDAALVQKVLGLSMALAATSTPEHTGAPSPGNNGNTGTYCTE